MRRGVSGEGAVKKTAHGGCKGEVGGQGTQRAFIQRDAKGIQVRAAGLKKTIEGQRKVEGGAEGRSGQAREKKRMP